MKFISSRFLLLIIFSLLVSGCSPHPGTGVWKTADDNEMGIEKLVIGFEGRAEFVSTKQDKATWHCFWRGADKKELLLDCKPSTNPDQNKIFIISVNDQGLAEFRNESSLLATFTRTDENPSPKK